MTVDIKELRLLLKQISDADNDDRRSKAADYFAEAAEATMPQLLDVYEAACEWRDSVDEYLPLLRHEAELTRAVDAARGGKS